MLAKQLVLLLKLTRSQGILRRYFVVNGFDGALTMLGLIISFSMGTTPNLTVIINACLGAAIALGISGISSVYISEQAERKRALTNLERAMLTDLKDSAHGDAARFVPMIVAVVNGSAPLIISLIIIFPLWLSNQGISFFVSPLYAAALVAISIIFLLGVFLGHVSGLSLFWGGLKALLITALTLLVIYAVVGI